MKEVRSTAGNPSHVGGRCWDPIPKIGAKIKFTVSANTAESSVPITDKTVNKHKGMMTSLLSHHDASDTVACCKHCFCVHSRIPFLVLLDAWKASIGGGRRRTKSDFTPASFSPGFFFPTLSHTKFTGVNSPPGTTALYRRRRGRRGVGGKPSTAHRPFMAVSKFH